MPIAYVHPTDPSKLDSTRNELDRFRDREVEAAELGRRECVQQATVEEPGDDVVVQASLVLGGIGAVEDQRTEAMHRVRALRRTRANLSIE